MNLDEIRKRKKSSSPKNGDFNNNTSQELGKENNFPHSLSYCYIKNNRLYCKLSSLRFIFSIELSKLQNTSVQELYSFIVEQNIRNKKENHKENFKELQTSDYIYLICKPQINSFKEALLYSGNFTHSRLFKESELFMLGKLIYKKGLDVKGFFKIKYDDIEIRVEAGDGVIEIKEEIKSNEIADTDPTFILLGVLLMMKIIHGYCTDIMLLSTFPHDLKIRLSDTKGSYKEIILIEKDTTIPVKRNEYVSSGLWNSIDIFLDDTLIIKSLPSSLNKILKEIELEIDCSIKPCLRIKGIDGEIKKIDINKKINV